MTDMVSSVMIRTGIICHDHSFPRAGHQLSAGSGVLSQWACLGDTWCPALGVIRQGHSHVSTTEGWPTAIAAVSSSHLQFRLAGTRLPDAYIYIEERNS